MTTKPVIIQGTAVDYGGNYPPQGSGGGGFANALDQQPQQTYAQQTYPTTSNGGGGSGSGGGRHGEKQANGCKDPIFALLFYGTVLAILAVAATFGPHAFDTSSTYNYKSYVVAVVVTAVISLLLSGLGLLALMAIPETIIKVALIFVVAMALVWCVFCFAVGSYVGGAIAAIFFVLSLCYMRAAWPRIPFAAANLTTAVTAIKANFGVTFFAYLFAILAAGWSVLWSVAFAGVFDATYSCNANGVCSNPSYGYMFLLFVAFFFAHQVIQVRITFSFGFGFVC